MGNSYRSRTCATACACGSYGICTRCGYIRCARTPCVSRATCTCQADASSYTVQDGRCTCNTCGNGCAVLRYRNGRNTCTAICARSRYGISTWSRYVWCARAPSVGRTARTCQADACNNTSQRSCRGSDARRNWCDILGNYPSRSSCTTVGIRCGHGVGAGCCYVWCARAPNVGCTARACQSNTRNSASQYRRTTRDSRYWCGLIGCDSDATC